MHTFSTFSHARSISLRLIHIWPAPEKLPVHNHDALRARRGQGKSLISLRAGYLGVLEMIVDIGLFGLLGPTGGIGENHDAGLGRCRAELDRAFGGRRATRGRSAT
ncbi:MAG: hypothetical protein M1483_02430 [Actinobacteria bacterium]|nr:hypothetical protein [Actinomycetota bacterium]MCL6104482.1 hypothetical protein [Actinomycetota bacterium]